jgi:hypothetical protein
MTEFAKLVVLLIVDGWGSGSPADEIGSMGFGQIDGGIPDWLLTDGRAWAVVDWVLRNEGWASQHYGEGALMRDRRLLMKFLDDVEWICNLDVMQGARLDAAELSKKECTVPELWAWATGEK